MKIQLPKIILPGHDRVKSTDDLSPLHRLLIGDLIGGRTRIGGAAESYILGVADASALTTAQVAFLGPLESAPGAPLVLALAYIGNTTLIPTTVAVTYNLNRTDTPAVIASAVVTNAGAGTSSIGSTFILGIVPFGIPATNGVSLSGAAPSGSPVPKGSATSPQILAFVGLS